MRRPGESEGGGGEGGEEGEGEDRNEKSFLEPPWYFIPAVKKNYTITMTSSMVLVELRVECLLINIHPLNYHSTRRLGALSSDLLDRSRTSSLLLQVYVAAR